MSTTYPGTVQTFVDPAGTAKLSNPDHTQRHIDESDTIEAIQAVMGTTAGTSVLKNFAAGDFPARIDATNVLQQAVSGTVNNSTLGTPDITGGTVNNSVMGTPDITGGSITSTVNMGTVLIKDGGFVTQSGTADHITITPGASKLVKTAVLRQDNTTNTYTNKVVTLTGWGFIQGLGTTTNLTDTISFGVNFSEAPVVVANIIGRKENSDPSAITESTSLERIAGYPLAIGTSGFSMYMFRTYPTDGNIGTTTRVMYSWLAMGSMAS